MTVEGLFGTIEVLARESSLPGRYVPPFRLRKIGSGGWPGPAKAIERGRPTSVWTPPDARACSSGISSVMPRGFGRSAYAGDAIAAQTTKVKSNGLVMPRR